MIIIIIIIVVFSHLQLQDVMSVSLGQTLALEASSHNNFMESMYI